MLYNYQTASYAQVIWLSFYSCIIYQNVAVLKMLPTYYDNWDSSNYVLLAEKATSLLICLLIVLLQSNNRTSIISQKVSICEVVRKFNKKTKEGWGSLDGHVIEAWTAWKQCLQNFISLTFNRLNQHIRFILHPILHFASASSSHMCGRWTNNTYTAQMFCIE